MFGHKPANTPRSDLRAMLADGFFFSVMVGIGETYLPAFVLAVSKGRGAEVAAGLITSIPLLVGALLQLLSPAAVRYLGSHRRWVVLCGMVQASSFVPLSLGAFAGWIPLPAVFLVAAVYWGFGMGAGPAWNTWAETLVPKSIRTRYFAQRTRFTQAGILTGFVIGGCALHLAKMRERVDPSRHWVLYGFAGLFLIAGLCRFVSSRLLASQSEPMPLAHDHRSISLGNFIARIRNGGSEQLLAYFVVVQFTVYISGPYFNPFMLGHLHLSESYGAYMVLIATCFLGKMLALPALGHFAHRWGAQRLLWLGAIGIAPISGLWLVSNEYPYLMCVQFLGGLAWAAYELAIVLLAFDTIRRDERTSLLTTYNVGNALAMVLGSLCGGALLRYFGEQRETYLLLFGLSSLGRLTTLLLLARIPIFRTVQPEPVAVPMMIQPSPAIPSRGIGAILVVEEETQHREPKPQGALVEQSVSL